MHSTGSRARTARNVRYHLPYITAIKLKWKPNNDSNKLLNITVKLLPSVFDCSLFNSMTGYVPPVIYLKCL